MHLTEAEMQADKLHEECGVFGVWNVADAAISISLVLLIVVSLFGDRWESKPTRVVAGGDTGDTRDTGDTGDTVDTSGTGR